MLGLALFLYRGEAGLNVDFRGGTVFAGRLKDGEERGLSTTDDGKLGFRELLSEDHQKEVLNPTRTVWDNEQEKAATANTFVYTISYADNTASTVTLTQKPAGANKEEMARDVLARASHLPDVSVEQMYLSDERRYPNGKSRYFTIRTTEKQPELVRASLDRLLRDDKGQSLMAGATMSYAAAGTTKNREGKEIPLPALTVDQPKDKAATVTVLLEFSRPTSRSYVQELLEREYRTERLAEKTANLTPVGDPVDGRFTKMKLDISKNEAFSKIASTKPDDAADKARRADAVGPDTGWRQAIL